jgi:hypothetical protein
MKIGTAQFHSRDNYNKVWDEFGELKVEDQ